MSSVPPEPIKYDVQSYPFGQSGALGSDDWLEWGTANPDFVPLTVSFQSGLAVKSLWFPFPQGPMSFYAGDSATGTPFYTTPGVVAELVPIPNDAPEVTISGPTVAFFFYASSYGFAPFSAGTPPEVDVAVTAPIINTGTPQLPIIGLATPLAVVYGGSGSDGPSLIAGSNVVITGSWPDQTISVTEGAGGVQSVGANAPIFLTGSAQNPVLNLTIPLPLTDGGTGLANPWAKGGTGIDVNGTNGVNDNSFQWDISNTGVLEINPGAVSGNVTLTSEDGSLSITNPSGNNIDFSVSAGALSKVTKLSGSTPSGSLTISGIPAGTWLYEAYVIGLDCPNATTGLATLTMSTGDQAGFDNTQNTRYIGIAVKQTIGSTGSVSATLATSGGVGTNTHFSNVFFLLKATPIAP